MTICLASDGLLYMRQTYRIGRCLEPHISEDSFFEYLRICTVKYGLNHIMVDICRAEDYLQILGQELGLEIGYMAIMRRSNPEACVKFERIFKTFQNICPLFDKGYLLHNKSQCDKLKHDVVEWLDIVREKLKNISKFLKADTMENKIRLNVAGAYKIVYELCDEVLPSFKANIELIQE